MRLERFSGTHAQMGLQRGRAYRAELNATAERVRAAPLAARQRSDSLSLEFDAALRRSAPELIDELRGVAEGADLPYEEVLRLAFGEETGITGCSQVAIADTEGGAIMAKSEDAFFHRTYVVTELRPDHGHAQLNVGAVEWLVACGGGINDAGLCIGQSSASVRDRASGIPRLVLLRLALEKCVSVAEAAEYLASQETGVRGMNYLIVDASGDMAVVERAPSVSAVRRPENGGICCTNHYLDPHTAAKEPVCNGSEQYLEATIAHWENTRRRYGRLLRFISEHSGRPGAREALEQLMRTHGPGSVCQHGLLETTWSTIMVPRDRQLWVTDGPPCHGEFKLYALSER